MPFKGGGVESPSLVLTRGFMPNFFAAPTTTPLLGSLLTNPFNGPGAMPGVSFDSNFGAALKGRSPVPLPSFSTPPNPFTGPFKVG